jgi:hypothetical protein
MMQRTQQFRFPLQTLHRHIPIIPAQLTTQRFDYQTTAEIIGRTAQKKGPHSAFTQLFQNLVSSVTDNFPRSQNTFMEQTDLSAGMTDQDLAYRIIKHRSAARADGAGFIIDRNFHLHFYAPDLLH